MNKLITASIDVMKIDKTKIVEGKKGKYLNLSIWVNEEPDQYGNNFAIQQKDCKTYLGNGKWYKPKEEPKDETNQGKYQKGGKVVDDVEDSLPF